MSWKCISSLHTAVRHENDRVRVGVRVRDRHRVTVTVRVGCVVLGIKLRLGLCCVLLGLALVVVVSVFWFVVLCWSNPTQTIPTLLNPIDNTTDCTTPLTTY